MTETTAGPSLSGFVERLQSEPETVTVYGAPLDGELRAALDRFDVTVRTAPLPLPAGSGYLTVRRGDEYLGSLSERRFEELRDPPADAPWSVTDRSVVADLVDLLGDETFTATDRSTLVAVSREFEERAWRVGQGRLLAGFQSLSAFRSQLPVYRRLAADTDLSVAVYGEPDWIPSEPTGLTVHSEHDDELGRFWFVAFDGGDDGQAGALVAEEVDAGSFEGGWTDDPALVADLIAYVDDRFGRA
jgi:hypothetical protein